MNRLHGFVFLIEEELCEGNLIALTVTTPSGNIVQVWSEIELVQRTAVLRQLAVYGVDVSFGELGLTALRNMAHAADGGIRCRLHPN